MYTVNVQLCVSRIHWNGFKCVKTFFRLCCTCTALMPVWHAKESTQINLNVFTTPLACLVLMRLDYGYGLPVYLVCWLHGAWTTCRMVWHPPVTVHFLSATQNSSPHQILFLTTIPWTNSPPSEPISGLYYWGHFRNPGLTGCTSVCLSVHPIQVGNWKKCEKLVLIFPSARVTGVRIFCTKVQRSKLELCSSRWMAAQYQANTYL